MALEPKITVCLEDTCSKLKVTDVTGVYDANDNTGGWGSPNISGSQVDTAEIIITNPDGSKTTYDVTSEVPSSISGEFTYDKIDGPWNDGKYCINYHIVAQESETLPEAVINYEPSVSVDSGKQWTIKVDATGDGNANTTIGSYTTGTGETQTDVYDNLEDDINNNSSFSASNDSSSGDFTVTAPSGTGSTYNNRTIQSKKEGTTQVDTSFDSSGQDGVDIDKNYKICPIFLCHTRCCVEKMVSSIPDEICFCDYESFVRDTNLAKGYLRGIREAYRCNNTEKANEILKRIQRLCNFNNCDC